MSGRTFGQLFSYRRYRNEEARLDAMIEDATLRAAGVIEDDEPTEYSHYAYMERFERESAGEFTPEERFAIRAQLGLGPFADLDEGESASPGSCSGVSR